jgi:hypothetical protein
MRLSSAIGRISTAVLLAAACTEGARAPDSMREQRGDTLVIVHRGAGTWGDSARLVRRATFGEADGSDTVTLGEIRAIAVGPSGRVFAVDGQHLAIRVFDADLKVVGLWGRDGAGPGELRNPDGGLAVLSDGRVVVRDPGNARAEVFSADGRSAASWRVIDAGLRTRENFGQHGDTLLSRVVVDYTGPINQWKYGLARIAPDGRVVDTVRVPPAELAAATLVARRGNNTAELPLPFAPTSLATWHPGGGFAVARGDRYAITWPRGDGLVRVERDVEPVVVLAAESAQERAYVTKGLQWLDPTWTWQGPDIPGTKPLLSQLFVGRDGSVWALREGTAEDRDDPDYRPDDASSVERRLRSTLRFDVFDADGAFLGSVALPREVRLRPQPAFDARGFVALEIDEAGVPRLVRYGIAGLATP